MSGFDLYTLHETKDGRECLVLSGMSGGGKPATWDVTFLGDLDKHTVEETELVERKRPRRIWDSMNSKPAKGAPEEWVEQYHAYWRRRHLEGAVRSFREEFKTREERWPHIAHLAPSFHDLHRFVDYLADLWGPPAKRNMSGGLWGHPPREDVRCAWLQAYGADLPPDEDLEAAMAVYVADREAEWGRWQAEWAAERAELDRQRRAQERAKVREAVAAGSYAGPAVQGSLFG